MYSETQDSPLGWLWKTIAFLHEVLSALPYSEYTSAMGLFLAGSVVLLIVIIWFSKDSATKAMQAATERIVADSDQSSTRSGRTATGAQILSAEFRNERPALGLAVAGSKSNGASTQTQSATEEFPEVEGPSLWTRASAALDSVRFPAEWKAPDFGVTAKLVVVFSGIATIFALGTVAIVYYLSFGMFESQINKRADVIAMNLSNSVATPMEAKDLPGLRQELAKYSGQEDVAYIFVEDDQGKLVQGTSDVLPKPDVGSILQPSSRFTQWTAILYKGYPVYETRAGILDGKLGILHLGIWKHAVDKEINRILLPIVLAIFLIMLIGVMTFSLTVRGISKLLLQLAHSANRISEGQLDTSSWISRRDEIGKLAISLERIRASLLAATKRLDAKTPRANPPSEGQFSSQRL